jgi:nicotinamide mononucleotide transporter
MLSQDWFINYVAEPFAVLFGLLSIWYIKKEKLISFPFGIINVVTYVYIFFVTRLYANAAINGYFFFMTVYGWYNWSRKKDSEHVVKIRTSGRNELFFIFGILVLTFFAIRFILIRYTTSQVPFWDALTTAVYMMAQWMISQKRIENWLLWVFADVIMTILCISQGLWFTAFQYAVFTGIALAGFFEWRKKLEV